MNKQTYQVLDTTYHLHIESDGSSVVEVRYITDICDGRRLRVFSEYLNFEEKGNTADWWEYCSCDPRPVTNQHAVDIANYHGLAVIKRITVEYSTVKHNYRIVNREIGTMPLKLSEIW
ncbi:MAG: hypothetical protein LBJ67_07160 [Planctomycetaceae bacterium]|jgi:hypothetical protein|nr:hypothetical protein [Planctomycetaceae bacterium]